MTKTQTENPPPLARRLRARLMPGITGLVAVVAGACFVASLATTAEDPTAADSEERATTPEETASEVVLPPTKLKFAKLRTEPAELRKLQQTHTVPGRIGYNESRHIEIKSPLAGVVVDMLVKPGDKVSEGQVLARISSSEIGTARAEVLNAIAAHQLIQKQLNRTKDISANLAAMFQRTDMGVPINRIEEEFRNRPLGKYREQILAAYSEQVYMRQLYEAALPLAGTGGIPQKTIREREHNLHVAEAKFRGLRENAAFDISIELQKQNAELADATRRVSIARNHLETLLGYSEPDITATSDGMSQMEIRAPFGGTIESRTLARQERVEQSAAMFVLADTQTLYVSADIRENEWPALSVQPGTTLSVSVPAIPGRTFTATVHYAGRAVAPDSNSLPLVAIIDNRDGLLRPGMFARVTIPTSETDEVVAVPQESVLQHEQQKFVFVAGGENVFRRVDVRTGFGSSDWIEIRSGVQPGEPVVSSGAFLLKSELLLAGEVE